MAGGAPHRVIPEGVDRRPREEVAVVADRYLLEAAWKRHSGGEEHAPAVVLDEDDPDEKHHDGCLGAPDRHVLSQPVVPQMALQEVQADEAGIGRQRGHVGGMELAAVGGALPLCDEDRRPERDLM